MIKKVLKHRHSLTFRITTGMLLGLALGLFLNFMGPTEWIETWIIQGFFDVGGRIFVALLKLLVVPLVFVSLVVGTASLDNVAKLGRVGLKTLGLYILTTSIAIALAISCAVLLKPGHGMSLQTTADYKPQTPPPLGDVLVNIIPSNPFKAMVEGEMLQVIFFAIFFGIALAMGNRRNDRVLLIFKELDEIIMRMVMAIVHLAPYGVFCLIAKVFADQGFDAILPLAKYFFLIIFVLCLHVCLVFPFFLRFIAQVNPLTFFRKFKGVALFAFSTSSSNATIPVSLENATTRLGISNSIASFTIPLGATINMDGTAIMQGVATVFISQVYGVDIGLHGYLMVILTATLASVGTAGVPGVGLITLAMVLRQVNLPEEGIALVLGVDRLLDMARTVVNVTGDGVISCIVAKSEGQLDLRAFNSDPDKDDPELV